MLNKRLRKDNAVNAIIAFDLQKKSEAFYQELCREAGKDLRKEIPDVRIRQMLACKWILYTKIN